MYSFPDIGSGTYPAGFTGSGFAAGTESRDISSYESMDAGLTIKTREGDVVTLSTSRFSQASAREYSARGYVETPEGTALAATRERSIELSSGETFTFSVQGDLNEQELADIERIVAGVDGIIYEMAEGDMGEAIAKALSMGSYSSVAAYEADITVTRAYSDYSETRTSGTGGALPYLQGGKASSDTLAGTDSFLSEVSRLLEDQDAAALAHARQPLSQLFDHYLDTRPEPAEKQEAREAAPGSGDPAADPQAAFTSPAVLALEATARMVEELIQEMVRDAFGNILDQVA